MFFETILTRQQIEEYTRAGYWPDRRLRDFVAETAASSPDKDAVVDSRGRLSYHELVATVDCCALALLDLGVRRGDVVAVQLPNWTEFVVLMLAIERIGAVMNPIAPIFRQRELRTMLRLGQPVAIVVPARFRDFHYPAMIAELLPEAPSVRNVIVLGDRPPDGMMPWERFLDRGRDGKWDAGVLALVEPDPNDVAELMFTSGTTGEPKGVLHTHNTMLAATQAMIKALHLTGDDVLHMASTVAHQSGYLYGIRMALHTGGTIVLQDIWEAGLFVDLIEREGITVSCGATPFLADTVRAARQSSRDISTFRIFGCFGAPIPRPLLDEAREVLPCTVMPGWGMTEVALLTTTSPDDPIEKVVSSDGKALPGTAVRVVDEKGQVVAPGIEGDLYCRGCTAFAGYLQGRRFTEQFFDSEGWFETGDRAVMDADGFIRISGRSKDIIIRGGENIPVKEIEDIIISHPAVRNVALVAVPDERLSEIACACVIPEANATLTLDDLRKHLAAHQVTRQFWPERLVLLSEFPMTPSGKVQKFQLRDSLKARADG